MPESGTVHVRRDADHGGNHRHSALERVIEDSVLMLGNDHREALTWLAVFRGGFSLSSAETVLGQNVEEVLGTLSVLSDHGLIFSSFLGEECRYRILDSIRDFLLHKLNEGDRRTAARVHAELFAQRAGHLRELMDDGQLAAAVDAFWMDVANFRSAFQFTVEEGDEGLMSLFVHNMARFVFEAGMSGDFQRISTGVANMKHLPLGVLIEYKGLEGAHAKRVHNFQRCHTIWRERVVLCEQAGDFDSRADTLLDLADLALETGDIDGARQALQDVADSQDRVSSKEIKLSSMLLQAELALRESNTSTFTHWIDLAKESLPTLRDNRFSLYVILKFSILHRETGDLPGSRQYAKTLLERAYTRGYLQTVARGLWELATTSGLEGKNVREAQCIKTLLLMPHDVSPQLQEQARRRFTDVEISDPDTGWSGMLEQLLGELKFAD